MQIKLIRILSLNLTTLSLT